MKGDLEHFSGTQILHLVSLAKKTGTLAVKRRGGKANLSFQNGKLVYAAVDDADGSLASVLVRDKRINKDQAAALSKRAERTGDKQLGLLLIQKGYVTQADIVKSIKKHAVASVNQFAMWKDGAFVFNPEQMPSEDRITVPLDLENIIVQIARMQKRDEQLEEEIPSLDVRLKFTDRPQVKLKELKLNQEEWRLLNFVKPDNTIRMIGNKLSMSDKQVRRVVGSLREAGLVELVQNRPREQLSAEERTKKRAIVGRLISHFQGMGAE